MQTDRYDSAAPADLIKISMPNMRETAINAVSEVLKSGNLVQGKYVAQLEEALGLYLGVPHVALVSSGTAALHLSLLALELPEGSGVIVPNFTFPATVNAVLLSGLTPVIAEVDLSSYVVTERSMREAIESAQRRGLKISALLPVHEFGRAVEPQALQRLAAEYELKVIEDAACALGASYQLDGAWRKVGSLGDAACFSFHPRKTLTTGEGGAVVTRSRALYERVCALRSHGMVRGPSGVSFERPGLNYRMTDLQAALGLTQLPHLDAWIARRRELAAYYHQRLQGLELALPPLVAGHSWQSFMVRTPAQVNRDQLITALRAQGIESNIGAQVTSELPYLDSEPRQRALSQSSLAIPLCERYDEPLLDRVASALAQALGPHLK